MSSEQPIIPIILCGGSGTRLWPASRQSYPKQLLSLVSEKSLLQDTILRLHDFDNLQKPICICNDEYRFVVAAQLAEIKADCAILLEPVARNTAPAVAMAALHALTRADDPTLLVLPSDHVILDIPAFVTATASAIEIAAAGALVTFGVVPSSPETGYGYIKAGAELKSGYAVEAFKEKPDKKGAEAFVQEGNYYWNSGMFVFKAGAYLGELKKYNPAMLACCEKAHQGRVKDLDFVRMSKPALDKCPHDSIDYAVMEKTDKASMVPLAAGWSDVGSWKALWDVMEKDDQGNSISGDVISLDNERSLIIANGKLVAVVGMKDTVIVETPDALLVGSKERVQDVKKVVDELISQRRHEHLIHPKVYRPWGYYENVDAGPSFLVKRIEVNPGASLSLQLHHHRAEHWVVVSGQAEVTKGDEVFTLRQNESTYIPVETKHRLANRTETPLQIVEVQTGDYLGEDDIERFEDDYGRTTDA